jgi:hypothetical protein
MLKNLFRASTLGAAAVMVLGLSMPEAGAATGYARCPNGYFCIFAEPNGGGTIAYFKYGSQDLRKQHIDNAASSYWNRASVGFSLCDDYNYIGYLGPVWQGTQGNMSPETDNRTSSVARNPENCY